MAGRIDTLDEILGKEVVAYSTGDDQLALRFSDGTILKWSGYHCTPTNPDDLGTRDVVEEKLAGEWAE